MRIRTLALLAALSGACAHAPPAPPADPVEVACARSVCLHLSFTGTAALAVRLELPPESMLRLLNAAVALRLAEPRAQGFHVVDSFSRIVRLGEGLAATGVLGERAIARTLAALKVCRRIMDRHRVTRVRCVATEACRRAGNGPEFIRLARRAAGIDLEVLGQDEEARLAMLGCLPLIDPTADQLLMLDIGGGSTEIMWLDRREATDASNPGHTLSMPLGVVTLSETFGGATDEPTYGRMVQVVVERLAELGYGTVQTVTTANETLVFALPREIRPARG